MRREFPVVSVVGYTNCGEEGGAHVGGQGARGWVWQSLGS